ncbi:phosphotransferase family protein [Chengkuizengella sediminis]|uniref:phosphotransferase family protein n=1 Tax=Chengkuizengella sediminis TaxID=1885917 RepID=UPI00138A4CDF|nr:phosphotransferase [Chengkuizengella sediminis]NDI33283.1 phosphotransferase [Chengkuizengella sediminis]
MNKNDRNIEKMIGQGRTADIYEYGENQVLKLFKNNIGEQSIIDEYNQSKIVQESGLDVPSVSEMVDINDRKGIVYEKIDGKTMFQTLSSQPMKMKSMARQMAQLQYSIHQTSSHELPDQKEILERFIQGADLIDDRQKEKIIHYLHQLPNGNVICHGDYHPDNVMITPTNVKIIDWNNASRGHHLADVTRTFLLLKYGTIPAHLSLQLKFFDEVGKKQFYRQYLKTYLSLSGDSINDIHKWEVPIAAARLAEGIPDEEKQMLYDQILKTI